VSEQPEEQDGTVEEVTGQPLGAWSEPAEESVWANIEDQAESAAPGPAGPGASPEVPEEAATEVQPATEAGRSRRPTSLRDQYVQSESVPRRKLEPPPFPSAPAIPGSPLDPPLTATEQAGNPGHVHNPAPSFREKLPLDKLSLNKLPLGKLSFAKLPLDKLSRDKLPTDKLPVDKLRTLTKQRPEVGLGLAFAGGLVLATILKRLGRR
jgi:hypothetical protein